MRMFDYDGKQFRIANMEPETAFHVGRRLLPLITSMSGFLRMRDDMLALLDGEDNVSKVERMLQVAKPLIDALSSMPDDNANYVLHACLERVFLVQNKTQSTIYNKSAQGYQHQLKLPVMLLLCGMSIVENLSDFFPAGDPSTKVESPTT